MATQGIQKYRNYVELKFIGKGAFGKVFLVEKQARSGDKYALKRINLQKCDQKDRDHSYNEVSIMQENRHENLVNYHDTFIENDHLHIVMEYCANGNLRTYIKSQDCIEESECIHIMSQICEGLKFLHKRNIVHRDVKTTNIFLTKENKVKIGDFGVAILLDKPSENMYVVGTPYYLSPEMVSGQPYHFQTDVWSLGCCLFEIGTKQYAFHAETINALKSIVKRGKTSNENLPSYSKSLNELFMRMVDLEAKQRPTIEEVYSSLQAIAIGTKPKLRQSRNHDFMKTCPASLSTERTLVRDMAKLRHNSDTTGETSGYDTCGPVQHGDTSSGSIVQIPVRLTEDEQDEYDEVKRLEAKINKKIEGNKRLMDDITVAITKTKNMDDEKQYMTSVEASFKQHLKDPSKFRQCKKDLHCLWIFKKELLNKSFKMAAL